MGKVTDETRIELLEEGLHELTPFEELVVLVHGTHCKAPVGRKVTFRWMSDVFHMTREKVRQIEQKALAKLTESVIHSLQEA